MNITLNLSQAWLDAIDRGLLMNEFKAQADAPDAQWRTGDLIRSGLVISLGNIDYLARNLTTDSEIKATVAEERRGCFVVQRNDYRVLKGGGGQHRQGRCRFYCGDVSEPLSILNRTPLAQISLRHHTWEYPLQREPIREAGPCPIRAC